MIADRVLFIDAEALVLDKPAGLAVHPGPRTPHSLADMLDALRFGFPRRPSLVHRLDPDTSVCLLLSPNPPAHRRLAAAFEAGAVGTHPCPCLYSVPEGGGGLVYPIGREWFRVDERPY